jgi:rRNA maturation endonuclease Nob1
MDLCRAYEIAVWLAAMTSDLAVSHACNICGHHVAKCRDRQTRPAGAARL